MVYTMVNLVIMRHGDAEPMNLADSKRQLTARGRAEVSLIAEWLSANYPAFDLICSSPYVRTQQTAELVYTQYLGQSEQPTAQEIAPNIEQQTLPELVPEGDSQQVQSYLDALWSSQPERRILLVSHMPLVSFLVETFTRGGSAPIFETSGVVLLQYEVGNAAKVIAQCSPRDLLKLPSQNRPKP